MNHFARWKTEQHAQDAAQASLTAGANLRAPVDEVQEPAGMDAGLQVESSSPITAAKNAVSYVAQPLEVARQQLQNHSEYLGQQWQKLSNVQLSVPDAPVQAVADYSVGYGKHVASSLWQAVRKWQEDDAGAMAAGVAYYLALSLFPMILLLTSGLGLLFRYTSAGRDAETQILSVVAEHCSPTLEQQVREVLSQLREHSVVGGPFGLVTAILAAIGVFYQFERAFDRIWKVPARKDANWRAACVRIISQRLSAFCLLASVGLAIVFILLANVAVGFVHAWMLRYQLPGSSLISAIDSCASLLLNAVVFGMLYRWLPKRRIQSMDAFRGGVLAALVWEGGRQLLGAVLIGVRYTAAYGAIGSFIALLLWCYWGVSIIFFGAEYAQVLSDGRRQKALLNSSNPDETPVPSNTLPSASTTENAKFDQHAER